MATNTKVIHAREQVLNPIYPSSCTLFARFANVDAASNALAACARQQPVLHAVMLGEERDMLFTDTGFTRQDGKVARSVLRYGGLWGIGGVALGALVGVLLLLFPPLRQALGVTLSPSALLVAASFAGFFVGGVAFVVGYVVALDPAWCDTDAYEEQLARGSAWLGLRLDEGDMARADDLLRRLAAERVQRERPHLTL